MQKRCEHQIVENILDLCEKPALMTKIVYQCNLNFRLAHHHINKLIAAKLIMEIPAGHGKLYQTTPKGLEALVCIHALNDLLKPVSQES